MNYSHMNSSKINHVYILAISKASEFGGLLFGNNWVVIRGEKTFSEPFIQFKNFQYYSDG